MDFDQSTSRFRDICSVRPSGEAMKNRFTNVVHLVTSIVCIAVFSFSLIRLIFLNVSMPDEPPVQLWAVRFVGNGDRLVTVGGNSNPYQMPRRGELVVWNLKTCKEQFVIRQKSSLRAVACSPNGRLLAVGGFDGQTKLLSSATGATIAALQSDAGINAVAFSHNGDVISGSLDGVITIWDVAKRKSESYVLTNEGILNVAVSGDCSTIVATTQSGKAFLLNLLHPEERKELRASENVFAGDQNAEGVAFAPSGKVFATASQSCVRVWESPTGKLLAAFNTPENVNSVVFSPNGSALATVDTRGALALWDAITGQCRITKNAHVGTSFCVTFSPDGDRIATIGRDDFLTKVWDAFTLTPLMTLTRTNIPIESQ